MEINELLCPQFTVGSVKIKPYSRPKTDLLYQSYDYSRYPNVRISAKYILREKYDIDLYTVPLSAVIGEINPNKLFEDKSKYFTILGRQTGKSTIAAAMMNEALGRMWDDAPVMEAARYILMEKYNWQGDRCEAPRNG